MKTKLQKSKVLAEYRYLEDISEASRPVFQRALELVAAEYFITNPKIILRPTRQQPLAECRHIVSYILSRRGVTHRIIGHLLGCTTNNVTHSVGSINKRLATEPRFSAMVERLRAILEEELANATTTA